MGLEAGAVFDEDFFEAFLQEESGILRSYGYAAFAGADFKRDADGEVAVGNCLDGLGLFFLDPLAGLLGWRWWLLGSCCCCRCGALEATRGVEE